MAVNIIPVASASKLEKEALKKNEKKQLRPLIQGLAAHVSKRCSNLGPTPKRRACRRTLARATATTRY